ncbi:MAG: ribonuclease H-like domain-containing protein [Nitrospirae bacterium]|nr:ribonuclease H-like domain-containing protein [Nitrospirota bacterium]
MIQNTFSILNGIGVKLERRLWENGILTWKDFLNTPRMNSISSDKKAVFDNSLCSALQELKNSNARYFAGTVKRKEHWRLFDKFKGEAVCLDIETSGLMPDKGGYVTVVGMYDGCDYRCFVIGNGLSPENLNKALSGYKYLITFYGAVFDIPFLFRSMPGLRFDIPHFDICFGSRKLGFQGGLKKLETSMGVERDEAVKGMDGYDAVKLWGAAQNGSSEALDLLKLYNREDTVNLFGIAEVIYQQLRAQTGIEEYLR